ncbi:hypothetical protein [Comamonas resistens]|uniref:Uncharacterized protein n=1 Tax=Comamonas resistens TaxID=3046670 RepID=A0ABY8SL18_9BURK|nr:hypothetical protein [Comamonas resistens]MDL5039109.1 hypothetical protein [Comamonas resistens]WHS63779.1 hypothetical protein QMY55_14715 [Comamonas resistens]
MQFLSNAGGGSMAAIATGKARQLCLVTIAAKHNVQIWQRPCQFMSLAPNQKPQVSKHLGLFLVFHDGRSGFIFELRLALLKLLRSQLRLHRRRASSLEVEQNFFMALRYALDHDCSIDMQIGTNPGTIGLILIGNTGLQTHPAMLPTQAPAGNAPDRILGNTRLQIDRYPLCLEQQKRFFLASTGMSLV